jgi:hypothetical protein
MPRIERLVEKHAAQGLSAVGIAIHMPDDDIERDEVKSFMTKAGIRFPTFLIDEPGYDRLESVCRSMGASGLVVPTAFVTDARGRILSVLGGKDVETLPRAVVSALRGESSHPPGAEDRQR